MSDSVAALAQSIVSSQSAATRGTMQTVFIKQQADGEKAIAQMLQQSAESQKAVLPEGQGVLVDQQA